MPPESLKLLKRMVEDHTAGLRQALDTKWVAIFAYRHIQSGGYRIARLARSSVGFGDRDEFYRSVAMGESNSA